MTRIITFFFGLEGLGDWEVKGLSVQCVPLASGAMIAALALIGLVVLGLGYGRMRDTASARTRYALLGVRLLALALVLGCLVHPIFAIEARRLVKGRVPILIDSSQSMTVQDAEGMDRFRAAERVAKDLAAALAESHEVRPYVFSDDVAPQALSTDTALPDPKGRRTDLGAALLRARRDSAGEHLAGIVLITDGGNNHGPDPIHEAERLGVPLYVVGVGARPDGPDLQISGVTTDPFPGRGDSCPVQVSLRAKNLVGEMQGELFLKHQGKLLASRPFRMAEPGSETVVALDYVPDRKGPMEMTLQATASVTDQVPQNNFQSVRVNVSTRKIRVLMLDGRPRWEYAFLRRALVADDHVSVMAETRVAPEMVYKQSDAYTRLEGGIFPRSLRELSQFDVLIIGDVKRTTFSIPQLFDIESFVAEEGGGLILLGGLQTLGPEQRYTKSPIARILPFAYSKDARRHEGEVTAKLTADGARHPVMQLDNDPERNAGAWENLNPMWGCWGTGILKASALVLATAKPAAQDEPERPALIVQRYGRGRALVFAGDSSWRWSLCPDRPDQAPVPPESETNCHARFWCNAVRWASGEVTDPDERAFVSTDKSVYAEGETVAIRARILDEDYGPEPAAKVTATVSRGAEEIGSLDLKPETGTRGFYRGALRVEQEGRYSVTVKSAVARDGKQESVNEGTTTIEVESACREFTDVAIDEELLRRLAAVSGGKYFSVVNASGVAAELRRAKASLDDTLEIDPLDAPLTWLLFVALLLGEWIFRKTRGMA